MTSEEDDTRNAQLEPDLEKCWMLFERVVRSTAHSVGNAINVVSGRLSLLELDDALGPEGRQAIQLIRDRLRKTHDELKGAVMFAYGAHTGPANTPVVEQLRLAADGAGVEVHAVFEQLNSAALACVSRVPLELPIRCVREASKKSGPFTDVVWKVSQNDSEGLMFTLTFDASDLPADRRSVLEPWFEHGASALDDARRYARLMLATALGRFEEGGSNVAVAAGGERHGRPTTVVRLSWPLPSSP